MFRVAFTGTNKDSDFLLADPTGRWASYKTNDGPGALLRDMQAGQVCSLDLGPFALAPDGWTRVSDQGAELFIGARSSALIALSVESGIAGLPSFNRSGQSVVHGSDNGIVYVWDIPTVQKRMAEWKKGQAR